MKILSHRDYWLNNNDKNSKAAFARSFELGFGVETDIRDYMGDLVISHDIADNHSMKLDSFFELYNKFDNSLPLAINIKSDGLQIKLKQALEDFEITNYFVFDMSVPDGLGYLRSGINTFTRQSEFESQPSFYHDVKGVWMDEFREHWISEEQILKHIDNEKQVCIVSPELHGRKYKSEWLDYKKVEKKMSASGLMICTDKPIEAKEFFDD